MSITGTSPDNQAEPSTEGALVVDFCGEIHTVSPGEDLTFGREADLSVDDNPYLHRMLGRFEQSGSHWWVANIGSRIELNLFDRRTRASAVITPGTSQALTGADMVLRFVAGRHSYELLVTAPTSRTVDTTAPSNAAGVETVGVDSIAWTDEQRLLMTILAQELLQDGSTTETFRLPTNQEARDRLGWSEAKFNRKLDGVCDRLTAAGVPGLEKGVNKRNTMRRRVLATVAVSRAIVTTADLTALAEYEAGLSK